MGSQLFLPPAPSKLPDQQAATGQQQQAKRSQPAAASHHVLRGRKVVEIATTKNLALEQPSQPCEWIRSVPKTLIQYPSVVRAPSRHQKAPPTSSKAAFIFIFILNN